MSTSPPDAAQRAANDYPPPRTRIEGYGPRDYPPVVTSWTIRGRTLFAMGFYVMLGVLVAWLLWTILWVIVFILIANLSGWHPSLPGSPAGL